jgi:small-conductance mechanosensitive channel
VADFLALFLVREGEGPLLTWLKEGLSALLIVALFWGLSLVARYILNHWGPKFTSFTKTDLDDRILRKITPPVSLLVLFAGLYLAVASLPLPARVRTVATGAVFIANVFILTNIGYRALHELLEWYAGRMAEKDRGGLDRQLLPLAEKVGTLLLIITALMITLQHFRYDILSFVTALGIGSLAIGMAAKDTLAHVISGFTLMLDRPFRIGDRIQLSGGQLGDVAAIGLRSTKIRTLDNMLLIIPNSDLCNTMVVNQAFPDNRVRGRTTVGVAYGSDVEQVKQLLIDTALEIGDVLREPLPEAYFVSFGDHALNMSLFFWVDDYGKLFAVTDRVNSQIIRRFREQSVNIPFPIRTVIMTKDESDGA